MSLLDKQLLQQTSTPEDTQSGFPVEPQKPTFATTGTNQNDPTRPSTVNSLGAHLIQQSNKQATSVSPFSGPTTSFANIPTNNRFPSFSPFLDNEELSAQSQSWYSKAGNAITKGAGIAASTFLQGTAGAVFGVGKWIEDGKFSSFYNNEFSQGLDQWNQSLENSLPNYYTQSERDANWYSPENLFSANFVFDKVIKNLGYAAGAYASGAGWANALKALSLLSKISVAGGLVNASVAAENAIADVANVNKLSKIEGLFSTIGNKFAANYNLLNRTQRVMYGGLMSTGEAAMEALQNSNQFRQKLIDEYYTRNGSLPSGLDLENINKQVDQVGNLTFGLNTALLTLTNTIQLPKIIGSSYNLERRQLINGVKEIDNIALKEGENTLNTLGRTSEAQEYVTNSFKANTKFGRITQGIGSKIYNYGFSPSEAFEEGAQSAISVGTQNYYDKKNKQGSADIIDDLFGYGAKQALTTKDGVESILIGGLSGALSEFRGKRKESKERSVNTQAAINAFNQTYLGSYLKSATDSINRNENLQQERVEAIKAGNILESKDLETDITINYLTPRIQYGKYDLFLEDINQYKQILSTPEGLQQLKDQGVISEDATQQSVLDHLNRLQEYGNTVRSQYDTLNAKYSSITRNKERVYTDDVINKMVYASAKVDDYSRRIPEISPSLLSVGIIPQEIIESTLRKGEETDSLIANAVQEIDNLPILQDGKDELRQNLADVIEMSARRKKFLDEYKDIRDNPEKYYETNELNESPEVNTVKIGDKEFELGKSYTPKNPVQTRLVNGPPVNGRLEINQKTQILGVNSIGEISITTPDGVRSIPLSQLQEDDLLEQPITRNQTALDNKLNKAIEDFFNTPENNGISANNPILNDPNSTLEEKVEAINGIANNGNIISNLKDVLEKTIDDFIAEEKAAQELQEKLEAELAKVQDEISAESVLENPENLPIPENEDKKKPVAIRFKSSTSKSYKSPTEGEYNNYHKREAEFLNLLDSSNSPLDRSKIKVVPVTVKNQDQLGLPGFIPESYEREDNKGNQITVKNTDPNRGTVALVYVYETSDGLKLLDKDGNILNKLGENNDPNIFVYTNLATTDLTYHSDANKGERNYSTPNKETPEQVRAYQQQGLADRKSLMKITSLKDTPNYSFTVSLGIPNILTNEEGKVIPMNNSVVDSGLITQEDLSNKKLLSSRFPLGDTYLDLNGKYLKLNTQKFNESEANKIYNLLRQMVTQIQDSFSKTGTVTTDPVIKNYLSRIIYFDFPRNGQKAKPKQIWISTRGTLHLGPDIRIEPTLQSIEDNKDKIINFFNGAQQNVNPYQVNNDTPFVEITHATEDSYTTVRWKSYQHFLLSPVYELTTKNKLQGTTHQPILTTNIIVPQILPDGTKEVPLMNKYITIEDEIVVPQAEEPSEGTISQFDPFVKVEDIAVKEVKDYDQLEINTYAPQNQLRFGQGTAAAVWMVGDEQLLRYYTLESRQSKQLKSESKTPLLTEDELNELQSYREKYGAGIVKKLKSLAKENRKNDIEQIVILGNAPVEEETSTLEEVPSEPLVPESKEEYLKSKQNSDGTITLYRGVQPDGEKGTGQFYTTDRTVATAYANRSGKDGKVISVDVSFETAVKRFMGLEGNKGFAEGSDIFALDETERNGDLDPYNFTKLFSGIGESMSETVKKEIENGTFWTQSREAAEQVLTKLPNEFAIVERNKTITPKDKDSFEVSGFTIVKSEVSPKPVLYLPLSDMTERMTSLVNENTGKPYTQPEVWNMRTENIEKILKANDLWYQVEGYETKLISTEDTLNKVKEFLKRVGTTIETVESIKVNGTQLGGNGVTFALDNLIQIVEGKENVALPEEGMHIATELIRANNPSLYQQLLTEATKSEIYNQVLKSPEYRDAYRDVNGRVNVSALQREAISKILAEYVIRKNQSTTEKTGVIGSIQKLWNNIISFLKSLFSTANFNPFDQVATQILEGTENLGKQKNIGESIPFYQISNNKTLYDRLKNLKVFRMLENGKPVYMNNGIKVPNTVDQRVENYYREKKANKEISDTQLKDSQKRRSDNENAHLDINDILSRYIDNETGLARRDSEGELTPIPKTNLSQLDSSNNEYYDTLEEYLSGVISSYPEGTQFLFDQVVYDETSDEAGKLDFIAIKPEGTHDELNFKFLNIDTDKKADVPFYDKRAYNIEMTRLSRILANTYGLKKQGLSRTIPIVPKYNRGENQELNLQSMKIGDTNVEHVNEKYLLPVPSEVEAPKTKGVGKLMDQLNELIGRMEESNTEKSTKFELQKQINNLTSAIRLLQVKDTVEPLIRTVGNQIETIQKQIENYNTVFKAGDEETIRGLDAEEISKKLIDSYDALEVFKGLAVAFKDVYASNSIEYKKLRNLSAKSANSQADLVDLAALQTNSLANRYGIEGILLAEKNVGYIAKKFFSLSDARTASTQLLSRIVNRVRQQREFEFEDEIKKIAALKSSIEKGNLLEKAQDLIFAKEKGKKTGLLTPKYQVEFYKALNDALSTGNKSWIEENVNLDAYSEEFRKSYEAFKEHLETTNSEIEDDQREQLIDQPLEKFAKSYDIVNFPESAINESNERLQRFPKGEKWYTDQYKQITQSIPILKLYNYMVDKNHEAYDIGLFKTYHGTFFANVKKGFVENLTFGLTEDGTSAIRNQVDNIFNFKVETEDNVYGYVDPITGQPKDKIFAYYTSQISADQKSYDIFKVLTLWNHEVTKYKYLSEVENQVKLLHLVESNKNHLETDKFGNIKAENIEDAIAHGNDNNSKYLKEFIDATIYGRRFSTDQPDFGLSVGVEKLAKGINKIFGSEIVPMPDKQKIQVSAVKMIDSMNRWFRLKAMGLNPLSGLSALVGGTANAALNAGTYGKKSDYLAANLRLVGGKFGGAEGKRYAALMKYFVAHADSSLAQKASKMSLNQFQRYLQSGDLMILLKKADEWVQNTNLLFFSENHTVVDGNFVSIPQYIKDKNNYDQLFDTSKSTAERQALKKKIDTEIAEMKRTQSLVKQIKIEGDEISFENIERNSEAVYSFRDKIQQFTREAIGNSTPENVSQINRTIIGQSLMMFKSWIPATVSTRFGGLRYVVGKDAYDYGRARILGTVLRDQGLKSINTLLSYYVNGTASQGQDNMIDLAKRVYQQKIETFRKEGKFATDIAGQIRTNPETGENLTAFETKMTEVQFVDMYLRGFDAAVKDVLATLSMAGILFSMRAYAPDKDDELDPQSKGYWRWAVRTVDKLQDELGFFYNPFSWQTVIGGQIFPSVAVLSDIKSIVWNGMANTWLYMNGDEEAADKMKVAKYVFKNIPGLNQGIYYAALFNSDLADELGIKITAQAKK